MTCKRGNEIGSVISHHRGSLGETKNFEAYQEKGRNSGKPTFQRARAKGRGQGIKKIWKRDDGTKRKEENRNDSVQLRGQKKKKKKKRTEDDTFYTREHSRGRKKTPLAPKRKNREKERTRMDY